MSYQPVDRLPVMALEPFEQTALERWRKEGLPQDAQPVDFLSMSKLVHVPVGFGPIPGFEQKIIREDGESYDKISSMGATIRHRKENPTLFYGHIDHPIKTRRDWEEYKERFKPHSPGRRKANWVEVAQGLNASPDPVGVCIFPFFFRFGFYSMGMERFLTAFHEEPGLMHEIFAYLGDFVMQTLRPILDSVTLDFVLFAEDLAGKNGPLISPRMYEEFWYPYQDPIVRMFRERGEKPVMCQWSAGRFQELLPGMLKHGFNCTWPLEVMAGMDAPALRRQLGRDLRLGGNIPKEAVIAGPKAIDKEIARLLPLIREGGFLPALDDMASPDMPFSHYRYMIERLQRCM